MLINPFDLDIAPARPALRVERYVPNVEILDKQVCDRIRALRKPWSYCLYINPLVIVESDFASKDFFREARRWQSQWARQSRNLFGIARRHVRTWVSDDGYLPKKERFLQRARCFTGVLFIEGRLIQPHRWRDFEFPATIH